MCLAAVGVSESGADSAEVKLMALKMVLAPDETLRVCMPAMPLVSSPLGPLLSLATGTPGVVVPYTCADQFCLLLG
jgi:hypothetical protein